MQKIKYADEWKDAAPEAPKMGLERYPEFKPLVWELKKLVIHAIQDKADKIQSEMPYKQQFVLESLIRELEKSV
jgi:hypothetical protein